MAVLMMLDFDGMSVEQYEQVNESMDIRGDEDAPDGLISHTAALTDNGIMIVDVWESEESLERFFEERLGAALAEAGVPQTQPRVLPAHAVIPQGAGADAGVLMIIESDDFTPELYERLTAKMPSHKGDGSSHPAVSHVAARTEDGGMVFVDVWDSPESFGRFAENEIGVASEGEDVPALEPRFLPIHNRLRSTARV
jgi:hypothetical protein